MPARWLFWISTHYPLFVAAQLWMRVLPSYLQSWLFGDPAGPIRIDPASISAGLRGRFGMHPMAACVALVAFLIFRALRHRWPDAAGRGLALTGLALIGNSAAGFLFRNAPPSRMAIPVLAGFTLLVIGLRWAVATIPGSYWHRVGFVLAGFALPAALPPFLSTGFGGGWFGVLASAPPILAASALLFKLKVVPVPTPALRAIGAGLLASLLAFAAIVQGRAWQRDSHDAGLRAELAKFPQPDPDAKFPKPYFHRGVNFTANGFGYESPQARALLAQLPAFGIQAVAVVPYGGIDRRTLRMSTGGSESWESDLGVEIIAAAAHQRGMTVLLKPQLWRPSGELPLSGERRDLWFREYAAFIEHYARLARRIHADTFCIGVELEGLTGDETRWRRIIAQVRKLYGGPLVYAANHGAEFESIRFWDALDYIGLDNYYPLPDDYGTEELVRKLEAVSKRYGRPLLFTEAGYSAAINAHRMPWEDHPRSPLSVEEQARCYEALLAAFYGKPWFAGVYWWKIETDGSGGKDDNGMVPWGKPAMQSILRWYGKSRAAGD